MRLSVEIRSTVLQYSISKFGPIIEATENQGFILNIKSSWSFWGQNTNANAVFSPVLWNLTRKQALCPGQAGPGTWLPREQGTAVTGRPALPGPEIFIYIYIYIQKQHCAF